jgi:hypothetical protein
LLRERENELGKDLVRHDGLRKLIGVVCETAKGEGSRLLDAWDVIK